MAKTLKVPGIEPVPSQPLPETHVDVAPGLPNALEVDPYKITQPVLTRQGWICPHPDGVTKPAPR